MQLAIYCCNERVQSKEYQEGIASTKSPRSSTATSSPAPQRTLAMSGKAARRSDPGAADRSAAGGRAVSDSPAVQDTDDGSAMSDIIKQEDHVTGLSPALHRSRKGRRSHVEEEDHDSDSDSDEDDESDVPKKGKGMNAFAKSDSEDSDEESDDEHKGKILSAAEKRLLEMEATGKTMENALKINDWVAISNGAFPSRRSYPSVLITALEFDKLVRLVQRQSNVAEPIPSFYIRTLVELEGNLNKALAKEKEAKKKMNATNARALTAMKQKVRKAIKEQEDAVKRYQAVRIVHHTQVIAHVA